VLIHPTCFASSALLFANLAQVFSTLTNFSIGNLVTRTEVVREDDKKLTILDKMKKLSIFLIAEACGLLLKKFFWAT
jgi:hypothetical protein